MTDNDPFWRQAERIVGKGIPREIKKRPHPIGVQPRLFLETAYPRNEINTPAATAEPITPEMLLAMQYCKT